jgi:hypothetical protein
MDHHCSFLWTCIAYKNYKFFILTLFYTLCILYLMVVTLFTGLKFFIHEYAHSFYLIFFSLFYFLIILFCFILTFFFIFHLSLVVKNMSTIEYLEYEKKDEDNFYSKGWYSNWTSVMGSIWWWFLPIRSEEVFKGYCFDVNKEKLEKVKKNKYNSSIKLNK